MMTARRMSGLAISVLVMTLFAGCKSSAPAPAAVSPKPASIAKPLAALESKVLEQTKWTGHHEALSKDLETVLGVDEYLNLLLASPDGTYNAMVFVTYNANAMLNVPHVLWVCMTQSGFKLVSIRQDRVTIAGIPGREIMSNVILFEKSEGPGPTRALMFQYFNVGGTYTWSREMARVMAVKGSPGRTGSFLSQTMVAIWVPPGNVEDLMDKNSSAYRTGLEFLNVLVPLLEKDHYPKPEGEQSPPEDAAPPQKS
jgi:hypothetical protein